MATNTTETAATDTGRWKELARFLVVSFGLTALTGTTFVYAAWLIVAAEDLVSSSGVDMTSAEFVLITGPLAVPPLAATAALAAWYNNELRESEIPISGAAAVGAAVGAVVVAFDVYTASGGL
jgi:hypothetical protein